MQWKNVQIPKCARTLWWPRESNNSSSSQRSSLEMSLREDCLKHPLEKHTSVVQFMHCSGSTCWTRQLLAMPKHVQECKSCRQRTSQPSYLPAPGSSFLLAQGRGHSRGGASPWVPASRGDQTGLLKLWSGLAPPAGSMWVQSLSDESNRVSSNCLFGVDEGPCAAHLRNTALWGRTLRTAQPKRGRFTWMESKGCAGQ